MQLNQIETTPRVSVIVIFLNAETYFVEAIDSVLNQSFVDFELLLCDDGSTDSSVQLAKDYAARDPRVRYLEHPNHENRGMSATRNLGLRSARGEFVAFIDADDVWEVDKLSDQVAIMEAHPDLAMCCGAVDYWSSWAGKPDQVILTGPAQDRPIAPPETLLKIYPFGSAPAPCPSDLLLRRSVVMDVGCFEEHFTGPRMMYEDQGFLCKLYIRAPVYFSSKVWLHYRQHPESCVAAVHRDGRYHEVRGYFLQWYEQYLRKVSPSPGWRVMLAVRMALFANRRLRWREVLEKSKDNVLRFAYRTRDRLRPLDRPAGS